jgi:hypothetical protein
VGALTLRASEDGKPFVDAVVATDQEVKFTGKPGSTYRFLGVGRDLVGREETAQGKEPLVVKVGREANFPPGTHLLTLPLAPEDLKALLKQTGGKWVRWDASAQKWLVLQEGTLPPAERVPGQGFLVALEKPAEAALTGSFVKPDQLLPLSLERGWNLIGNPFAQGVPWEKVQVRSEGQTLSIAEAQKAGWVEDYAWGLEDGKPVLVTLVQGTSSTLAAGKGYWVKAHRPVELLLAPQ